MKRRDFLKIATGSAGGAGAIGAAGARSSSSSASVLQQEGNNSTSNGTTENGTSMGNETATTTGSQSTTKEVEVGPDGNNVFAPETVYVKPGDTVRWVWRSSGHNVAAQSGPDGAEWDVQTEIVGPPFEYEHTFDGPTGEYNYVCTPHASLGMEGKVVVNESGAAPSGEGGQAQLSPHDMGVPFQAHYVGIATILMIFVSLVYTFFVLKYGESRHASAPNKE